MDKYSTLEIPEIGSGEEEETVQEVVSDYVPASQRIHIDIPPEVLTKEADYTCGYVIESKGLDLNSIEWTKIAVFYNNEWKVGVFYRPPILIAAGTAVKCTVTYKRINNRDRLDVTNVMVTSTQSVVSDFCSALLDKVENPEVKISFFSDMVLGLLRSKLDSDEFIKKAKISRVLGVTDDNRFIMV